MRVRVVSSGLAAAGRGALLLVAAATVARSQSPWLEQGPGPVTHGAALVTNGEVSGAIHAIVVHPDDPNVVYVGSVNGGLWKTTNALAPAPHWVPQSYPQGSLAIGALAFDPTDATHQTVVAGTGSMSAGYRRPDRNGVIRTTDGGSTWTFTNGGGILDSLHITGIAPRGQTIIASVGACISPGCGIMRSADAGATWTRISGSSTGGLPDGPSYDLASDPSDATRLFTNAGESGVYRSTTSGVTWVKVSDAAMDAVISTAVNVEISVGTANNVYVAVVNGTGGLAGMFRSGDGGASWAALDVPAINPRHQGDKHLALVADPVNPMIVYLGGDNSPLYRGDASRPSGAQFVLLSGAGTANHTAPHPDSRDMVFASTGDLIEVDDGGVYRRTLPGTNAGDWFSMNGDLRVTEMHNVAWDANSRILIGGTQDNGVPQQVLPAVMQWTAVAGGDGGDVAVDDAGTPGLSIRYSSSQNLGSFARRVYDAANTQVSVAYPALTVLNGGAPLVPQSATPVVLNAADPRRLIIGGSNSVYESLDQGDNLSEIGPNITVNASRSEPIAYGATSNPNVLYLGSAGRVFVRTAAAPAPLVQSATYPVAGYNRWITDIVIDPTDPQIAFVLDESSGGAADAHVYRTPDAGNTWSDITGNLHSVAAGRLLTMTFSAANVGGSVIVGGDNGVFIARGPSFNNWMPLGSGLPRAPVADLEYDGADRMLIAATVGRGAWSTSLDERDPVDIALILDLSGSMLAPACGTCSQKLQVLKDAVELFVQLFTVFAIPTDRMSVTYFRTSVSEFTIGGTALLPFGANAPSIVADVQSQSTVPANLTAMGGAIQTALNRLTDGAHRRSVVLFTDGMQNVNPMVAPTTLTIENQPGRPASGVSPTTPPTTLNAALGITVNTIGVAATPVFATLLDDIATRTGGVFKITAAPDADLRRFFVEELVQVLRGHSPQLVAYRKATLQGDTSTQTIVTGASARRVSLQLSWERGRELHFTVEKDGVDVTAFGRTISGPFYQIFAIDVPATVRGRAVSPGGEWRMRIRGTAGSQYDLSAISEESQLEYEFSIGGRQHVAGEPLALRVRLSSGLRPVTGATVTARVLSPEAGLGTLLSEWPRPPEDIHGGTTEGTPGQRKLALLLRDERFNSLVRPVERTITLQNEGNGTYSAVFDGTRFTGSYTVIFEVKGPADAPDAYRRTEARSTTVRFGKLSRQLSRLRVARRWTPRGMRYSLSMRPVDIFGNYLGPDYGTAIDILLNGKRVPSVVTDDDRGEYTISFYGRIGDRDPLLTVALMGEPLFSGRFSGLAPASGRP